MSAIDLESLYAQLPVRVQNWAATLEGRRIARLRYGAGFGPLLNAYVARTYWSSERIAAWRDQRVRDFVRYAAHHVPYYRSQFEVLGISAADIHGLNDLRQLPVLHKADVQQQRYAFEPDIPPTEHCVRAHTSGTTGAALQFQVTLTGHREQWATWWRYRQWHGISTADTCGYFGGRSVVPADQRQPPYWRYNHAARQVLFSAYHLSPSTAPLYLAELRRSAVTWLHGYPSTLAFLASHADGPLESVRHVTTGAETLLPHQRQQLERAFGVRVRQHYGVSEGVANMSMCPEGRMHIDEDFAAVELLPLPSGGYGILGTNFTNPAFPLMRFDTGDIAELDDSTCNCGRPGRAVASIDGRQEDYVLSRTGARLGRLDHMFKDMTNIGEAQIRQTTAGHMTVCIVRRSSYSHDDERMLRREIAKRLGDAMGFDIEYVERLKRSANGKLRFVVSTLPRDSSIDSPAPIRAADLT